MNRDLFRSELIRLMTKLRMAPVDISERFDASIPSVERWINGLSAPAVVVRKLVVNGLSKIDKECEQEKKEKAALEMLTSNDRAIMPLLLRGNLRNKLFYAAVAELSPIGFKYWIAKCEIPALRQHFRENL